MKIYILILLFLSWISPGFLHLESYFEYIKDTKSFDDAVDDCNNRGLELLTMSTYRQYRDARNYFNLPDSKDESWLALELNTTTGNYQWLNGRVLTELKWLSGEPKNYTGTDCGVMDVSSKQWYTTLCTDSRHYLCVGSDGGCSVGSVDVDFYTAVLNCQSEGRLLPVAITNIDTDWLNDVIDRHLLSGDFWLGLIESGLESGDYFKWVPRTESGDYYRWITGEHLTPPYTWANSDRESTVHYHHSGGNTGFHSTDWDVPAYVCQTKSTEPIAVVRSPDTDKFALVSGNALILGSIRKATTINSSRRFQCALECLRDAGCIQYTIQDHLCRTFGEGLVITDYNGGYKLWQRKIIS